MKRLRGVESVIRSLRLAALVCANVAKISLRHAEAAPASEPIVDRLMPTILQGGASRHRSPFLITTESRSRSGDRQLPRRRADSGKYRSIRRI